MDKNEILRKAQAHQGADEMEAHWDGRGSVVGLAVGLVVCVAFGICKGYGGQPNWDVFCLYFSMLSARSFYKWKRMGKTGDLLLGILSLVAAVGDGARYLWFLFG